MTRAVVFAYHNVGVRCLATLIRAGVDVGLVITHTDNPNETIWFESVEALARERGIPVITPADPNTEEVAAQVAAAKPDFLFSFYYRHMLRAPLLAIAPRGSYNMHGSLLPKYRGRVPVNWAIIHGESETGATLHAMTEKPDNGPIVAQEAVPIGRDDTAREVFDKVTGAAERALERVLPALIAGTAIHQAQDLAKGAYYGGRKAEDGRIDFTWGALRLHNFVRALTVPYPGAFADIGGRRVIVWRTRVEPMRDKALRAAASGKPLPPMLSEEGSEIFLRCVDGQRLAILALEVDGKPIQGGQFEATFGRRSLQLT